MRIRPRPLLLAAAIGLAALAAALWPARRPPSPAPPPAVAAPAGAGEGARPTAPPDPARRAEQRRRAALPWGRDPFADHGAPPGR